MSKRKEYIDISSELKNKVLDLDKVLSLEISKRDIVMGLFENLMKCVNGDNGLPMNLPGSISFKIDMINGELIYNTLVEYGYIIDNREKKINDILKK